MVIYEITNKLNGKLYVGQTIQDISRRFQSHIDNAKKLQRLHRNHDSIIGNAISKYGRDNFSIRVLQICSSQDELNDAECHWISVLNTLTPNGYNIRHGGSKGAHAESTKALMRARTVSVHTRKLLSEYRKGKPALPGAWKGLRIGWTRRWTPERQLAASGTGNFRAILDAFDVIAIRRMCKDQTYSQELIGRIFGVTQMTISKIHVRANWKIVSEEY